MIIANGWKPLTIISKLLSLLTYNDSEILKKPFSEIRKYKLDNPKNIKLGHLNVNSMRNKFSSIAELVKDNIDVLLISETKIN